MRTLKFILNMVGGHGRDMSSITVLAVNTEYQARADTHIPVRRSLPESDES